MKSKMGRLFYMGSRDVIYMLIYALFMFGVVIGLNKLTDSGFSIAMDSWTLLGFVFMAGTQSYQKYNLYITFGFCRKKFYREQCVLTPIRAAVAAIERTALQVMCYEEYVYEFTDGNVTEMIKYHPVSGIELFFSNMIIFSLVNIVLVITSTMYANTLISKEEGKTPRQKLVLEQRKQKGGYRFRNILGWGGQYFLLVILAVLLPAHYELQITNGGRERMVIVVALLILCVAAFVMGKRRYKPEYI